MSIPICVIPRRQEDADCAVVALAQWLGMPYSQVAAAVATVRPLALVEGMHEIEIKTVAGIFGRKLKAISFAPPKRKPKRKRKAAKPRETWVPIGERSSGILTLEMPDEHHAVVLFEGVIISDGKVWNYDAFMEQAKAKPLTLLTEDE